MILARAGYHHLIASKTSAKWIKDRNMTSILPEREKMRRNPLSHRNKHSTSLYLRYITGPYSQRDSRLGLGGMSGRFPGSRAVWQVEPVVETPGNSAPLATVSGNVKMALSPCGLARLTLPRRRRIQWPICCYRVSVILILIYYIK